MCLDGTPCATLCTYMRSAVLSAQLPAVTASPTQPNAPHHSLPTSATCLSACLCACLGSFASSPHYIAASLHRHACVPTVLFSQKCSTINSRCFYVRPVFISCSFLPRLSPSPHRHSLTTARSVGLLYIDQLNISRTLSLAITSAFYCLPPHIQTDHSPNG